MTRLRGGLAMVMGTVALVLGACGGPASKATTATTGATSTTTTTTSAPAGPGSGVAQWASQPLSDTAIPVGDGKVSTAPQVGYVDSCTTQFGAGGGARAAGPWLDTAAGTWNATTKIHVQGSVPWPAATHSFAVSGSSRTLSTDDLPEGKTTGVFPIASSDPAYQYDANPNRIVAQALSWTVPAQPQPASAPTCLGQGPIGVASDGVLFFDALDAEGRDAGAHEIQDSCDGHPQQAGIYHYHTFSPCLASSATDAPGSSTLVGYALDGYGIYLERDAKGDLPTDADLDACHGRTSVVEWDGQSQSMYHYDITMEYPYTLGCFHGTEVATGGNT